MRRPPSYTEVGAILAKFLNLSAVFRGKCLAHKCFAPFRIPLKDLR